MKFAIKSSIRMITLKLKQLSVKVFEDDQMLLCKLNGLGDEKNFYLNPDFNAVVFEESGRRIQVLSLLPMCIKYLLRL